MRLSVGLLLGRVGVDERAALDGEPARLGERIGEAIGALHAIDGGVVITETGVGKLSFHVFRDARHDAQVVAVRAVGTGALREILEAEGRRAAGRELAAVGRAVGGKDREHDLLALGGDMPLDAGAGGCHVPDGFIGFARHDGRGHEQSGRCERDARSIPDFRQHSSS
jgi:hypothetical protein